MISELSLKMHYNENKSHIKKRLTELVHPKSANDLFIELCFCLCTPQSKAKRVAMIINKENIDKLLTYDHARLAGLLRTNTRFHNHKAKYIIDARKHIQMLNKLPADGFEAREFLVSNIQGLGYKEASHFLRNIGYRNICIIDRHILDLMHQLKVYKSDMPPKNPKEYLVLEKQFMDYAAKIGINVDELDLLLWSIKTGFVFR